MSLSSSHGIFSTASLIFNADVVAMELLSNFVKLDFRDRNLFDLVGSSG